MRESDRLCMEYQLPIIDLKPKSKRTKSMSDREYRSAAKGQSWKIQLEAVISNAMQYAVSKEHFIELMELEGYQVRWMAERKNITYTTPDGQRCRDNKLHLEKFLKENMEDEFSIREAFAAGTDCPSTAEYSDGELRTALRGGYGAELESDDPDAESTDRIAVRASENTGRGLKRAQRSTADPYHEGRDRGLSETAAGRAGAVYGGSQRSDNGIPESDEAGGIPNQFETGHSDEERRITGWEDERELFKLSFAGAEVDEELYEEAVLDSDDSVHLPDGFGIDAIYLAGSLATVIDNRHHGEDCTTTKKPKRQRKNGQIQGPSL